MAFETCVCGVRFAVGLLRCPRCGAVAPLFAGRVQELPARVSGPAMPVLEPSFKQLRAVAKSLGLPAGGTAAELQARIAEHQRTEAGD
jgi:hypothetical protein